MFDITATVVWDGNEPGHVRFRADSVNLMQNAAEAMFRYIINDDADTEEILVDFLTGKFDIRVDTTGSYNSARILVMQRRPQGLPGQPPQPLHICDVMLRVPEVTK
jgi:hypothetical protein